MACKKVNITQCTNGENACEASLFQIVLEEVSITCHRPDLEYHDIDNREVGTGQANFPLSFKNASLNYYGQLTMFGIPITLLL